MDNLEQDLSSKQRTDLASHERRKNTASLPRRKLAKHKFFWRNMSLPGISIYLTKWHPSGAAKDGELAQDTLFAP